MKTHIDRKLEEIRKEDWQRLSLTEKMFEFLPEIIGAAAVAAILLAVFGGNL